MIAFLLSLMNNPLELDAFRRDPAAVIRRHSLSEEEAAAIKSGDMEAISIRLAAAGQEPRAFMAKLRSTANVRNKATATRGPANTRHGISEGKHNHQR
jgi:hypothetical protein